MSQTWKAKLVAISMISTFLMGCDFAEQEEELVVEEIDSLSFMLVDEGLSLEIVPDYEREVLVVSYIAPDLEMATEGEVGAEYFGEFLETVVLLQSEDFDNLGSEPDERLQLKLVDGDEVIDAYVYELVSADEIYNFYTDFTLLFQLNVY